MRYAIALLFLFSSQAMADRNRDVTVNNVTNSTTIYDSKGIALGIAASQHHFDFGTHSYQGSIGMGSFEDNTAISFGLAKRIGRVMVNASIGIEDGSHGIGVGLNWRF